MNYIKFIENLSFLFFMESSNQFILDSKKAIDFCIFFNALKILYDFWYWRVSLLLNDKNLLLGFDYTNVYQQKMSAFSYGAKAYIKSHSFAAQYTAMHQQLNLAYMIPIKRGSTFISHYKYDAMNALFKRNRQILISKLRRVFIFCTRNK